MLCLRSPSGKESSASVLAARVVGPKLWSESPKRLFSHPPHTLVEKMHKAEKQSKQIQNRSRGSMMPSFAFYMDMRFMLKQIIRVSIKGMHD